MEMSTFLMSNYLVFLLEPEGMLKVVTSRDLTVEGSTRPMLG